MKRRAFLQTGTAATLGTWIASAPVAKAAPSERIKVGVMGVRGRGAALLRSFATQSDVELTHVCDVDANVLAARVDSVTRLTGRRPKAVEDFRRILDAGVDALVIGTPDHWHAIPTILACQAGVDVYVEKPDGYNVEESRRMRQAQQKYRRVVQLGTQARSDPQMHALIRYLATGAIGTPRMAKAWESTRQANIGHPPDSQPPPGVNYDLWLGPAPLRPFNRNRFHGSWRWFFDYGTGDLGNDGVHRLDIARWALDAALRAAGQSPLGWPERIAALGGKYYFDDAQQWPDTLMVTYDYPRNRCLITYELRIWNRYPMHGEGEGAAVYGDGGYVVIGNRRWRAYDQRGRLIREEKRADATVQHVRNFLEAIRSRKPTSADLASVGHVSSMLCHLGNCAWRAGQQLTFDPRQGTIDPPQARRFLTRPEYRKPWLLPSVGG